MTQTIDAIAECGQCARQQTASGGKTDAETARNGDSFLAIIEKMLAGTMDGLNPLNAQQARGNTARGAGEAQAVPGELDTLNNRTEKAGKTAGKDLRDVKSKKAADMNDSGEDLSGLSSFAAAQAGQAAPDLAKHAATGKKTEGSGIEESDKHLQDPAGKLAGSGNDAAVLHSFAENSGLTGIKTAARQVQGSDSRDEVRASDDSDQSPFTHFMMRRTARQDSNDSTGAAVQDEKGTVRNSRTSERDRRARPEFTVQDLRTEQPERVQTDTRDAVRSVHMNADGSADMSLTFRLPEGSGELSRTIQSDAAMHSKSFTDVLSAQLRDSVPDIVRTGAFVLKDANSGIIRLTLHPETLGNVRISLDLNDRKVGGRIVVLSREAYDAFRENMDALRDAFISEGFEAEGFDLSWNDGQGGSGSQTADGKTSAPFYAGSIPDVMSGVKTADRVEGGYSYGLGAVNLLA